MKRLIMVGLMLLVSLATKMQGQAYQTVDLGALGGQPVTAYAISDNGQVVGSSYISGNAVQHAFLYSNGLMQDLGTLGGDNSFAYGINANGQVVGYSYTSGNAVQHAFLYSNGLMQDLGTLGGSSSIAQGINKTGQIVGYSQTVGDTNTHAFLYSNGLMQDLGTLGGNYSYAYGINDSGEVVGSSSTSGNTANHAFSYSNGSMHDLGTLGGNDSFGYGINNNGQIVGSSYTDNTWSSYHAFIYSGGIMLDLGTLGGSRSIAYAINDSAQVVGYSYIDNVSYGAFLYSYSNKSMLNLLDYNPAWVFFHTLGINNAGQIVGDGDNQFGQQHAFLLNPSWVQTINTPFVPHPYGTYLGRQVGKTNLVLITHGWIPLNIGESSTTWVDDMSNTISAYLTSHNLTDWQVVGYKWVAGAETGINPQQAIVNGTMDGGNLGKAIAAEGWTNVHLIAHSAGAALIQACSQTIKSNSPNTVVQCTFLDAFVGYDYAGIASYGKGANWADSYFTRDNLTGGENYPFTQSPLANAYNVDVTQLDPTKIVYNSFASGGIGQCYTTKSSHGWPITFYADTITGSLSGSSGLGFPVSQEGGVLGSYTEGNAPNVLGTPDPVCNDNDTYSTTPAYIGPAIKFSQSSVQQSSTGVININGFQFRLTTDSPAWLETVISVTNPVNLVSFDAMFTSTNAQGIASVYMDTNVLGFLDESVVQPGLQHYAFSFPTAVSNSVHMLGFRLDPTTNLQSVISITNVVLGYAGVSQPFSLSVSTNVSGGLSVFQLTGQAGFSYTLQASSNLVSWSDIAILVNTNGLVQFVDPDSANFNQRFYRAVAPF